MKLDWLNGEDAGVASWPHGAWSPALANDPRLAFGSGDTGENVTVGDSHQWRHGH